MAKGSRGKPPGGGKIGPGSGGAGFGRGPGEFSKAVGELVKNVSYLADVTRRYREETERMARRGALPGQQPTDPYATRLAGNPFGAVEGPVVRGMADLVLALNRNTEQLKQVAAASHMPGPAAPPAAGKGKGGAAGAAGGMGAMASLAALAIFAKRVAPVVNRYDDPAVSDRETYQGILQAIPAIGDMWEPFETAAERLYYDFPGADAIGKKFRGEEGGSFSNNGYAKLRDDTRHVRRDIQRDRLRFHQERRRRGLDEGLSEVKAQQQAYRELSDRPLGAAALAGFGAAEPEKDPAVRAAKEAEQEARRGARAADLLRDEQAERARKVKEESTAALREAEAKRGRIAEINSDSRLVSVARGPEVQKAMADAQQALERSAQAAAKAEEEVTRLKERQVALAEEEYEWASRRKDVMRAQVGAIARDELKVQGDAASFELMDPMRQQQLLQSVRKAKQGGVENLSVEERQLLAGSGVTGEWAQKQLAEAGAGNRVFQDLLKETGRKSAEVLKGERLELEARIKVEVDSEKLKEDIRKAIEETGMTLQDIVFEEIRQQEVRMRLEEMQRDAAHR